MSPLAPGFWSSRVKAHGLICEHSPCYTQSPNDDIQVALFRV